MFKGTKSGPGKSKKTTSKLSRKGIAKYAAAEKKKSLLQKQSSSICPEYYSIWAKASEAFAKIQREMFSDVLDAITKFAASSDGTGSSSLIPTCALLTGVNLPDHEDLFRLLVTELRATVSPHVAAIKSNAGGNTLRAMVQTTVAQLMLIQVGEDPFRFVSSGYNIFCPLYYLGRRR